MSDIDWKNIGLAAKDIVIGIAGVAAGAYAGPAGAEAVNKVGGGIDKALAMGGIVEDDKANNGNRAQKFDRDGKPPPPSAAPAGPALASGPAAPAAKAPQSPEAPAAAAEEGPLVGDNRVTVDSLRGLGWSRQQIQAILQGPERVDLASLTGKQVGGRRALGVEGQRIAQVDGKSSPARRGQAVRGVSGSRIPVVGGRKAGLGDDEEGSG